VSDFSNMISENMADIIVEEKTPDAEPATEETTEETTPDPEPEKEGEEKVEAFEIPGVGEFTLDEIREMKEARDKREETQALIADLQTREEGLEAARTLTALMDVAPEFRAKVQRLIEELEANPPAELKPDGGKLDTSKITDPRVDKLLKVVEPMLIEQERSKVMAQRDTFRAENKAKFSGIVDDAVLDKIEAEGIKALGPKFDFRDYEVAVLRHVATEGIKKAEKVGLDKAAEKGRRTIIVPAQAKPEQNGKPARMSFADIIRQAGT